MTTPNTNEGRAYEIFRQHAEAMETAQRIDRAKKIAEELSTSKQWIEDVRKQIDYVLQSTDNQDAFTEAVHGALVQAYVAGKFSDSTAKLVAKQPEPKPQPPLYGNLIEVLSDQCAHRIFKLWWLTDATQENEAWKRHVVSDLISEVSRDVLNPKEPDSDYFAYTYASTKEALAVAKAIHEYLQENAYKAKRGSISVIARLDGTCEVQVLASIIRGLPGIAEIARKDGRLIQSPLCFGPVTNKNKL
jgi:hypothetical protein